MPPVRPSGLQIAEKCSRAPWLAARYPEGNEATRFGNAIDADVSAALVEGGEASTKEGRALVAWVRSRFPQGAKFFVHRKVTLTDPVTGETLTEGTTDLVVLVGTALFIVDWKKKGQLFAGRLPMPDNNLQQMAYLLAAGMEFEAEAAKIILACFDDTGVTPIEGDWLEPAAWWPLLERVKAVPQVDFEGPEPEANQGPHCDGCYQRRHCTAYLLPAMAETPVALVPFAEPGTGLTANEAVQALDWLDKAYLAIKRATDVMKLVEGQVETFVTLHGPVRRGDKEYASIPTNGSRRGPTLGELEALGLGHLIKPGNPSVKFDWRKAKVAR